MSEERGGSQAIQTAGWVWMWGIVHTMLIHYNMCYLWSDHKWIVCAFTLKWGRISRPCSMQTTGTSFLFKKTRLCCFYPVWVHNYVWVCACVCVSVCVRVSARASKRGVERRVRNVWVNLVPLRCEESFDQLRKVSTILWGLVLIEWRWLQTNLPEEKIYIWFLVKL